MCGSPAIVDTKTIYGYWAYLCEGCNNKYGIKHWNTLLAGLSEGGEPPNYEWREGIPYHRQAIYRDARRALECWTIRLTMSDGKTKLITEGNIVKLKQIMNVAMQDKIYPVQYKVVEL